MNLQEAINSVKLWMGDPVYWGGPEVESIWPDMDALNEFVETLEKGTVYIERESFPSDKVRGVWYAGFGKTLEGKIWIERDFVDARYRGYLRNTPTIRYI